MYFYKLTLRNGKEYFIKDRENDINILMSTIARERNWRDFLLAKPKEYKQEFGNLIVKNNTVMLLTEEIISVEYLTNN